MGPGMSTEGIPRIIVRKQDNDKEIHNEVGMKIPANRLKDALMAILLISS
jgi:hypothetical protein